MAFLCHSVTFPGTVLVRMEYESLECGGTYPALFGTWLQPDIIIMQEMSLLVFGIGQWMWMMKLEPLTTPKMKTLWIIRVRISSQQTYTQIFRYMYNVYSMNLNKFMKENTFPSIKLNSIIQLKMYMHDFAGLLMCIY